MKQNNEKTRLRFCKRCGRLFRTSIRSNHPVCDDCNVSTTGCKILRVKKETWKFINEDIKKYSKDGLMVCPDSLINAYREIIKNFDLSKELKKIIYKKNGKNRR